MKNCLATLLLLPLLFSMAIAQHYTPVEQGSQVQFHVSHTMIFKSTVTGSFKGLKGAIVFDPNNLSGSSFDVSVQTKTISTGIGIRDNDLLKEKYFDEKKYPLIVIKSQSIIKGPHDDYIFSGMLIMKGVTKTISFPFTAKSENGEYIFKSSFKLSRLEYNVGPDNSIDKNVEVDLNVTAK